jgi:hypothetical protein
MQKSSRNRNLSKRVGRAKTARVAKTAKMARQSGRPPSRERANKQTKLLDLLRRPAGATIAALSNASGWQQHSCVDFWPAWSDAAIMADRALLRGSAYSLPSHGVSSLPWKQQFRAIIVVGPRAPRMLSERKAQKDCGFRRVQQRYLCSRARISGPQ